MLKLAEAGAVEVDIFDLSGRRMRVDADEGREERSGLIPLVY